MYKLKVLRIDKEVNLPQYAHTGDAGLDLCSAENKLIKSGEFSLIKTGIKIQLPPKTEAQIRPRSGLALERGITVLNSPGTIDENYRGEIGVILINHSKNDFFVDKNMRIAQLIIQPTIKITLEEVDTISPSERNDDGFGSSGIS